MTIIRTLALATLLALGAPAEAQTAPSHQVNATPPPAPPRPPEPDPDPAVLKAMRSRIFEIKHRSPMFLVNTLRVLGSGVRGARIDSNDRDGLNTISVRDFPENIAVIEEAIRRLDVPSAIQKGSDVELTLQVLFASKSNAPSTELPADLQEVVKQLKGTLAYHGYALAASFVQRAQILDNGSSVTSGLGYALPGALAAADAKDPQPLKVEWRASGLRLESPADGPSVLEIGSFWLGLQDESATRSGTLAKFNTPISLREGERVVVGTSAVRDHAVIVVLSARQIKR